MDPEAESTITQAMRRFTDSEERTPSLPIVKGILLATADTLLSTLSELVIETAQYDRGTSCHVTLLSTLSELIIETGQYDRGTSRYVTLLLTLSELAIETAQYDRGTSRRTSYGCHLSRHILLTTRDTLLMFLGLESMQPSELELVVQCKLELASIAQQRHHSAMAARIVLAAMRMLQNADVFKEKRAQMQAETKR